MIALTLEYAGPGVFRVRLGAAHIGNLKQIRAVWKFKAVGYEPDGRVIPGGGSHTAHHNLVIERPDAALLAQALGAA